MMKNYELFKVSNISADSMPKIQLSSVVSTELELRLLVSDHDLTLSHEIVLRLEM